jgi:uncharacterized protein (TIGR03437 family)
VGGAEAPIFAVAALPGYQQINIQVPQEAGIQFPETPPWPVESEDSRTDLVVEQGERRASVQVIVRKSPGDFFELRDGFGILQHASDYSLVTQENPARPGELIIAYLTGMPGTRPQVATGVPSRSDPPAIVPQDPGILTDIYRIYVRASPVDEQRSVPDFVGLVPGLVGVYQINFTIPPEELLFETPTQQILVAELTLIRVRCPAGRCAPTNSVTFRSKPVKIPIARKR